VLGGVLAPVGSLVDGLLDVDLLNTANSLVGCTVGSLLDSACCQELASQEPTNGAAQ
jgi:hypothetical protein